MEKRISMAAQERKWQAEEDARKNLDKNEITLDLARYQEIMGDSGRKGRAMKEATRQANDLEKRLKTMRAAGGKIKRK